MPRKPKAPSATKDQSLDGFAQQIELALEHFGDPEWLGNNSLLAAPFVLGNAIEGGPAYESSLARGIALKQLLQRCAHHLDQEAESILIDVYLQRNNNLNNTAIALKWNMSERTFYRWREQAIIDLANEVYVSLLPPLRMEQPLVRPMIGRADLMRECRRTLDEAGSVYVAGQSGVGKTLFGAQIYAEWPAVHFWYTVRSGLSDRLSAFLFALGYFLRTIGAPNTWRQLIADKGVTQIERIMSVIRYDLSQFQHSPLLVCIDEVDMLTPERSEHSKFLNVLDELRSDVRLLLIGQRVVFETDVHYVLNGFGDTELIEWLNLAGITGLDDSTRQRLLQVTNGHPALLVLLLSLHKTGEDINKVVTSLGAGFSMDMLLARIWRRLDDRERKVLTEIVVFGTAAPADFWSREQATLDRLVEKRLVGTDYQGTVQCDPHLAPLIYERTSADERVALHLLVGVALEKRGEYLRAMQHYVLARQPAQAVWLWFSHREQQISRGQGPSALGILEQIVSADLPDENDRTALALSRAELLKLMGRADSIAHALGALPTGRKGVSAAYAQQLLGDAQEIQGQIEQSLASYRRSLDTLTGSIAYRQVVAHQRLVYLHLTRARNLAAAKREAMRALFQAEIFNATVDEFSGDLTSARRQYEKAIALAQGLDENGALLATGYAHLGMVLLKLGDLETAVRFLEQAQQMSETRGDTVGPLGDRINRSFALTLLGRYEEALKLALEGLTIAERMRHTILIAGLAVAAADALYQMGDTDGAEQYVMRSLIQEEEFFRPWALTVLGLIQTVQGKYAEAVATSNMSVESAHIQEDEYGEAYALLALGEANYGSGNREEAARNFSQALRIYAALGVVYEAKRARSRAATLRIELDVPPIPEESPPS